MTFWKTNKKGQPSCKAQTNFVGSWHGFTGQSDYTAFFGSSDIWKIGPLVNTQYTPRANSDTSLLIFLLKLFLKILHLSQLELYLPSNSYICLCLQSIFTNVENSRVRTHTEHVSAILINISLSAYSVNIRVSLLPQTLSSPFCLF
jgi:hypothetical protein